MTDGIPDIAHDLVVMDVASIARQPVIHVYNSHIVPFALNGMDIGIEVLFLTGLPGTTMQHQDDRSGSIPVCWQIDIVFLELIAAITHIFDHRIV